MPWQLQFRASLLWEFPALSTEEYRDCSNAGRELGLGVLVGFGLSFMSSCPSREEEGLLWPQAWPPGPGQLSQCTAPLLGTVTSVGKGSPWRQVPSADPPACRLSQARPEALMRQKGIRAGIKIPGESEFLDSLV